MVKNLAILGSTGSIGKSTLEVIALNEKILKVFCISANKNFTLLANQINIFKPKYAYIEHKIHTESLKKLIEHDKTIILDSEDNLLEILSFDELNIVVSSMSGSSGLKSTYHALASKKIVLLANKESMVMAGKLMSKFINNIIPIDSEHNSIFQVIQGSTHHIEKISLTASGGPFRNYPYNEFSKITKEMALKHPNWVMGEKITIDSATMMNKCLEIIEAHYLFELPKEKIDVIIHPESIIHSLVEYSDGSTLCQLSEPDMKIPISYALGYPERLTSGRAPINLTSIGKLTFQKPDYKKFPSLRYAYQTLEYIENQKTLAIMLNAANEIAVDLFLQNKINFLDIYKIIESSFEKTENLPMDNINDIFNVDFLYRKKLNEYIKKSVLKG